MVPNPPKSDDHSTTMLPINERTPLTNSQVCCDSSLEASRQSIRYGGDNPLQDISESSNKSYQSYQGSIDSVRDHLVKAHTRLSDLIQYHTGTIGMLGSVSIAVNSLTGPAMLTLPATFARSGLIPTVACLLFVCILSALCCLHMASAISKVPGNGNFKKEIEYSQAFGFFWGSKWFNATQILFLCCITCLNISSIVDMSQVVDTFLGHWFPNGGTTAFQIIATTDSLQYNWIRWDYTGCSDDDKLLGLCTPFQDVDGILITAGKIVTTAVYLPLALMDLKENSYWQVLGFMILIVTSIQFSIQFATCTDKQVSNLTLWGEEWGDLFGVVLFNFALVIAIPAWLYERESHVDVPTVIHSSSVITFILYVVVGTLGCIAMPHVADNMLQSMMSGSFGPAMQLSASIFAFGIIGLGIPLFGVLTRLNLTSSGLCSVHVGNLLAVYLPFTVAMFLYDGTSVTKLLSWGGVIFTSLVVFVLPLLLALQVVKDFDYEGTIRVYFGRFTSKRSQLIALKVWLVLALTAVALAFIGNFYSVLPV